MHSLFFFFNDTATTEIYTLSLHDALPIYRGLPEDVASAFASLGALTCPSFGPHLVAAVCGRSEEHTSELQSQSNLVCRLLLEKKKTPVPCARLTPAVDADCTRLLRIPV